MKMFLPQERLFFCLKTGFLAFSDKLLAHNHAKSQRAHYIDDLGLDFTIEASDLKPSFGGLVCRNSQKLRYVNALETNTQL
jgi:hypothetical protein